MRTFTTRTFASSFMDLSFARMGEFFPLVVTGRRYDGRFGARLFARLLGIRNGLVRLAFVSVLVAVLVLMVAVFVLVSFSGYFRLSSTGEIGLGFDRALLIWTSNGRLTRRCSGRFSTRLWDGLIGLAVLVAMLVAMFMLMVTMLMLVALAGYRRVRLTWNSRLTWNRGVAILDAALFARTGRWRSSGRLRGRFSARFGRRLTWLRALSMLVAVLVSVLVAMLVTVFVAMLVAFARSTWFWLRLTRSSRLASFDAALLASSVGRRLSTGLARLRTFSVLVTMLVTVLVSLLAMFVSLFAVLMFTFTMLVGTFTMLVVVVMAMLVPFARNFGLRAAWNIRLISINTTFLASSASGWLGRRLNRRFGAWLTRFRSLLVTVFVSMLVAMLVTLLTMLATMFVTMLVASAGYGWLTGLGPLTGDRLIWKIG